MQENKKYKEVFSYQSTIGSVEAVEVNAKSGCIFLSSDTLSENINKHKVYVEEINFLTGKVVTYEPQVEGSLLQSIRIDNLTNNVRDIYLRNSINESYPLSNFCLLKDNLLFAYNYELESHHRIINFSKNQQLFNKLPNLFIFNRKKRFLDHYIKLTENDILDIRIIQSNLLSIETSQTHTLVICLYSINDKLELKLQSKYIDPLKYEINENLQFRRTFISKQLRIFNIFNNDIIIENMSGGILSLTINGNSLLTKEIKFDKVSSNINFITQDDYKILVACDSNNLNIYDKKTNKIFYSLISGSSTVIHKSFVPYKNKIGFHQVSSFDDRIIGVVGNMLRIYAFSHNLK